MVPPQLDILWTHQGMGHGGRGCRHGARSLWVTTDRNLTLIVFEFLKIGKKKKDCIGSGN